ncbi:hypothetical protein SYN65AY640_01005 [Synechococcus sp. 65AY640]|nr:hypothetical protein SYN65AY640_01005 [Synechococcus sp. 65AY640]
MIVASAGFGHCTDLPGFVDRQTLPRCDDVVALSPQSLWAIAGRGRIFQQRIHPMPRQLPQSQQNRKYRRGSQDAILAGCQPRRMARLAFPPAGPGNGQAFPGGERATTQEATAAATGTIGVEVEPMASWTAEHGKGQGSHPGAARAVAASGNRI